VHQLLCLLTPSTCAGTLVAKATMGDVFNALAGWLVDSVQWFMSMLTTFLNNGSDAHTVAVGSAKEFNTLEGFSMPLLLIGLLVGTLQALRHGDAAALWRLYLGVAPACVAGIFLARPLATMVLNLIDQLSAGALGTVSGQEANVTRAMLSLASTVPGFGIVLLALLVIVGSLLLWCELIIRGVALSVLLTLVPVVVPLATWPALRRIAGRLAETFVAVAVAKFLIAVCLAVGFNEVVGSGPVMVVTGGVTMVIACWAPMLLLRIIPFVEASALHSLDGLRQRATRAVATAPDSPTADLVSGFMPEPPFENDLAYAEDLGIPLAKGEGELPMPELRPPKPPLPPLRRGHVVIQRDHMGPVIGWEWDD